MNPDRLTAKSVEMPVCTQPENRSNHTHKEKYVGSSISRTTTSKGLQTAYVLMMRREHIDRPHDIASFVHITRTLATMDL